MGSLDPDETRVQRPKDASQHYCPSHHFYTYGLTRWAVLRCGCLGLLWCVPAGGIAFTRFVQIVSIRRIDAELLDPPWSRSSDRSWMASDAPCNSGRGSALRRQWRVKRAKPKPALRITVYPVRLIKPLEGDLVPNHLQSLSSACSPESVPLETFGMGNACKKAAIRCAVSPRQALAWKVVSGHSPCRRDRTTGGQHEKHLPSVRARRADRRFP